MLPEGSFYCHKKKMQKIVYWFLESFQFDLNSFMNACSVLTAI